MHIFLKMRNSSIDGRQSYIQCKHMYNLILLVLRADEEDNEFIYTSLGALLL